MQARVLELGHWEALLCAANPGGEGLVQRLWETSLGKAFSHLPSGLERRHLIVACPDLREPAPAQPVWLPEEAVGPWARFRRLWNVAHQESRANRAEAVARPEKARLSAFHWPDNESGVGDLVLTGASCDRPLEFCGLVLYETDHNSSNEILAFARHQAARWHTRRGGLLVHSAAVARDDHGYLFLGDSGAGKTTVADLSTAAGHSPLGDDLNFVSPNGQDGYIVAAAPGRQDLGVHSPQLRPRLRAVFTLEQAATDAIWPLTPLQAARALFDGVMQTPSGRWLRPEELARAFRTVSRIARQVPALRLRFRKSASFWDLVDARFPR